MLTLAAIGRFNAAVGSSLAAFATNVPESLQKWVSVWEDPSIFPDLGLGPRILFVSPRVSNTYYTSIVASLLTDTIREDTRASDKLCALAAQLISFGLPWVVVETRNSGSEQTALEWHFDNILISLDGAGSSLVTKPPKVRAAIMLMTLPFLEYSLLKSRLPNGDVTREGALLYYFRLEELEEFLGDDSAKAAIQSWVHEDVHFVAFEHAA